MVERNGLFSNIAWSVGAALLTNGLIFGLGWNTPSDAPRPSFAPPGWAVGLIWVILFAFMGAARWFVWTTFTPRGHRLSHWIVGLIVFCLAYPFYTSGLDSNLVAFVGNVATIILAAWIAIRVRPVSRQASALLIPVVAWVIYASAITYQSLRS
jgi:tryptophan-rich sensory protein